ncbi:hypothetical protein DM48_7686 [Burkholderia gladioli]|uniref:Uncharacterized protein n=2 Tax=Pseudomonadota TaxID=1224 RepID=A0A6M5CFJ3_PSEFL|nr:hypothetical protein [Burkholderia gladioli]KGC10924.1 hypothetical protein DM48_7686 [Burkholderia gladioli]QJT73616.1 hypothetical protein [Pseudomonas fluorescens]
MPLTAYLISEAKELDVEQVLRTLSQRSGLQESIADQIPDSWREFLRSDLECPCCFVTGGDIVKEAISRTSKKAIRQACFRFVSPGHRPQCDYASNDATNFTPENLVQFGITNSNLTRAVRELVCSGIQIGAFSQKAIRDMREWFFEEKIKTSFQVSLDRQVPRWLDTLWRIASPSLGQLPQGILLTREIAAVPGFDWSIESARILGERHKETLDILREKRLWTHHVVDRMESLIKRYHGEIVFDPTILQPKYEQSLVLARFISENYAPIKDANRSKYGDVATCVLALSALLLFVNSWDLGSAISTFASISTSVGHADQSLGNVMGLNPFHDYEAWSKLKQIQDLGISLPEDSDLRAERKKIEEELRARFQS